MFWLSTLGGAHVDPVDRGEPLRVRRSRGQLRGPHLHLLRQRRPVPRPLHGPQLLRLRFGNEETVLLLKGPLLYIMENILLDKPF